MTGNSPLRTQSECVLFQLVYPSLPLASYWLCHVFNTPRNVQHATEWSRNAPQMLFLIHLLRPQAPDLWKFIRSEHPPILRQQISTSSTSCSFKSTIHHLQSTSITWKSDSVTRAGLDKGWEAATAGTESRQGRVYAAWCTCLSWQTLTTDFSSQGRFKGANVTLHPCLSRVGIQERPHRTANW